jgi:hypothetical protein
MAKKVRSHSRYFGLPLSVAPLVAGADMIPGVMNEAGRRSRVVRGFVGWRACSLFRGRVGQSDGHGSPSQLTGIQKRQAAEKMTCLGDRLVLVSLHASPS